MLIMGKGKRGTVSMSQYTQNKFVKLVLLHLVGFLDGTEVKLA